MRDPVMMIASSDGTAVSGSVAASPVVAAGSPSEGASCPKAGVAMLSDAPTNTAEQRALVLRRRLIFMGFPSRSLRVGRDLSCRDAALTVAIQDSSPLVFRFAHQLSRTCNTFNFCAH